MKTFTLEEAQALLPVIQSLLQKSLAAKKAAEAVQEELQELKRRIYLMGGMRVDPAGAKRNRDILEEHVRVAKEMLMEIDSIGVQIKDLDTGLLDFPCWVDEEIVLLCWKLGEAEITHWHTVDAGFRGRQAIDDRFRRTKPN
jgi:hypothetical protein